MFNYSDPCRGRVAEYPQGQAVRAVVTNNKVTNRTIDKLLPSCQNSAIGSFTIFIWHIFITSRTECINVALDMRGIQT